MERMCIYAAVAVPIELGEPARRVLRTLRLLPKEVKVVRLYRALLLPIDRNLLDSALRALAEHGIEPLGIVVTAFPARIRRAETLRSILSRIAPHCIDKVPRSYYIVGDIALIDLEPEHIAACGPAVAEALMELHPNVKAVYARGATVGIERVRELIHLGGERRTITVHREHGVEMVVDIARAYFNPALGEEHRRVADLASEGSTILDAFSGVGPFALHIAKRVCAYVVALDINIDALRLLVQSIRRNRLRGFIDPLNTDTGFLLPSLRSGVFDHVLLNLPHRAHEYVEEALRVAKPGGRVHIYTIARSPEDAIASIQPLIRDRARIECVRRVLDYAPRKYIYRVTLVKL